MNFSDFFGVSHDAVTQCGAFDISLDSDLPLFIDPFLLFNSKEEEYQELHESILRYITFLRDKALAGNVDVGLLRSWFCFEEVRQNWLGFTLLGNRGHGLGMDFAQSLLSNLGLLFPDGATPISASRHLEKVSLIRGGVGKDSVSDFCTNLIKKYLLEFTEKFAKASIATDRRRTFRIRRVEFNYRTESWMDGNFDLPALSESEYVLLTPSDMLTRDDTWINRSDLIRGFATIPEAIDNQSLRAEVSNYLAQELRKRTRPNHYPNKTERDEAADATISRFPEVLDYYIALKEIDGERAKVVSAEHVADTREVFYDQLRSVVEELLALDGFYRGPVSSYQEALSKTKAFKTYVEDKDGYKLINNGSGSFGSEADVQLFFGLAFVGSTFDVNREPNNGRGPVDYAVSKGAYNKSLIEFKLGSNTHLKRNLEKQIPIYEAANQTRHSVKVIVNYAAEDERRVQRALSSLGLLNEESIIVIDARTDNKPSGSKA